MPTVSETPQRDLLDERKQESSRSRPGQLDPAYCLMRAKYLFGCYRKDDANDPEFYAAAIAAALSDYPKSVVEYATDPRVGLPSKHKFPPSVLEVKEFCDAEIARMREAQKPRPKFSRHDYVPPLNEPGCWANCFVGPLSPNYAAALAFTEMKDTDPRSWKFGEFCGIDGVWLSYPAYEGLRAGGRPSPTWQSMSDAALRAHYGAEEAKRAEKEFTE